MPNPHSGGDNALLFLMLILSVPTRRFLYRGMWWFLLLRTGPLYCWQVSGHDSLGCCRAAMRLFYSMPKIQGHLANIQIFNKYCRKSNKARKVVWMDKRGHRLIVSVMRNVWRAIGSRGHAVNMATVGLKVRTGSERAYCFLFKNRAMPFLHWTGKQHFAATKGCVPPGTTTSRRIQSLRWAGRQTATLRGGRSFF